MTYLLLAVPTTAIVWLSFHEWRSYRRLEETRRRYYADMDRYATRGGGHVWLTAADSPSESPGDVSASRGGDRSRHSDGPAF